MRNPISASSTLLIALTLQFPILPTSHAQTTSIQTSPMTHTSVSSPASPFVPNDHSQVWSRSVVVDGTAATLTRFERKDGRNAGLEGEHFSTVIAPDGTLKGFANISLDLVGKPLPTRERTEAIARTFLQLQAPDLLSRMKISWIEPHDEPIRIERNGHMETVTLTGMKVKARNMADGLWFWVIVGFDEKPMIFERDITWITFPGHRKTEKWLHDSWLKEQQPKEQIASKRE
ncbi:hypothetical protein [Diaphorobacter sp.]|uniref:hypothetical protein n=1 Tax=Diaphorobacter sp. TaxID=1934310 RepID=UPI0028A78101|nr:hypothetical protein [Diaphorobacter sp.]